MFEQLSSVQDLNDKVVANNLKDFQQSNITIKKNNNLLVHCQM